MAEIKPMKIQRPFRVVILLYLKTQ